MEFFLLVDNCILKKLISKTEFGHNLKRLDFLVRGRYVNLLVPEVLKIEWKKHREEEKKSILKSLKSAEQLIRDARKIKDDSADYKEQKLDETREELLSQLDIVDDLINNYGKDTEITQQMVQFLREHRLQRKKPFTAESGKDSNNDAELIFSSLDFLERNNKTELFFTSSNHTDFAFKDGNEYRLEKDISNQYPEIQVHYSLEIEDTFRQLEKLDIPQYRKPKSAKRIFTSIPIDRTKPLLEQLFSYITKRSEQLEIIPKEILIEHYPIILSETNVVHHKPFTIVTDNRELFELLSTVEVKDDEVIRNNNPLIQTEDDEKKTIEIFRYFAINLLDKVSFESRKTVEIKYSHIGKNCDCPICTFKKLPLSQSLQTVSHWKNLKPDNEIIFGLKMAYVNYRMGNFLESTKILLPLYETNKNSPSLSLYIICFNLNNLSNLLEHYYWKNAESGKLIQELEKIELEEIFKDCKIFENRTLIDWIHEKKFYKKTQSKMYEKLHDIMDKYYDQSSGFNEDTLTILECYYGVSNFLSRNFIMYDIFREFESLTTLYTESILASYGSNKNLGGRLRYFTDTSLENLLQFGKADNIRKFYLRYKLNRIEYRQTASAKNTFIDKAELMISDYIPLKNCIGTNKTKWSDHLMDSYYDMIDNCMVLLSITDFESKEINKLAKLFLLFLKNQDKLNNYQFLKNFKLFLSKNREIFSKSFIQNLFVIIIQHPIYHDDRLFEIMADIITKKKIDILLKPSEFKYIIDIFLNSDIENPSLDSWHSLLAIYRVLSDKGQKTIIKTWLENSLKLEFDYTKYYLCCVLDIITPKKEQTVKYEEAIKELIFKGPSPNRYTGQDYYNDPRINNFFNFCFKYEIKIGSKIKNQLAKFGDYYKWLCDFEKFDYSKFDPDWVTNHFTLYYKRAYRKSNALKNYFVDLIKSGNKKDLEFFYITTFSFED